MTYLFKVDSCKLSIPLSKCEVINQELLDHFKDLRLNESTGEVEELKNYVGKPYQLKFDDGTSVKIWIEKQINYDAKKKERYSEDYITLLVNSKHLKQRYFEGITVATVEPLYNYMMSLGVFKCTLSSFKKSRYSDIDICFDFKCSHDNFAILKENILRSAVEPLHFHTENKSENSGIWTPTRKKPREQATPSKPFIKFYSKEIDFAYKSTEFASKYFKYEDYKEIVRFECTIKNTQHKKRLGVNEKPTFEEFLKSDLQFIARQIFGEYFKKAKVLRISKMKPMDKVIIDSINLNIELGASKTEIQKLFDRHDVNPKARQRLLKKYHELYNSDEINKTKLEANQISKNIFEFLGVDINQTKIDFDEKT